MIEVKTDIVELIRTAKLNFKFFVKVDWPHTLSHEEKKYWRTQRFGTNLKTNLPSCQYEAGSGNEVWLSLDGDITPD